MELANIGESFFSQYHPVKVNLLAPILTCLHVFPRQFFLHEDLSPDFDRQIKLIEGS